MKIKTRLEIGAIFLICMVIAIGLTLFFTSQQVNEAHEQQTRAQEIVESVFELNVITGDYLLHQEERALSQWYIKYDSLSRHLTELEFKSPDEQAILDGIRQVHEDTNVTFSQLVASYEGKGTNGEETELREMLAAQLSVKLQDMVSDASLLSDAAQETLITATQTSNSVVTIFAIAVATGIGVNSVLIIGSVAKPIAKLHEGTEKIGSGNLDYRVGISAEDEIGQLSQAFDRMTGSLKTKTQELKRHTEHLEELVEERTRTVQEAREYAENIVDMVPVSLVVLGKDMKVISANRFFYQTYKTTPEETEGHYICDVGNRQWNIPKLKELLEKILPTNTGIERFEVEHDFPKLGHRVMLLDARRIYKDKNKTQMILLAIEDITERKRLQEKLITSEKLAAIGQLASTVGHELRNPLGVINNSSYFLNMKLKDIADEKVEKHLKIIEKEINSADLIISDLLDFARKKPPTLKQTDLNAVIMDALSHISIPENIKVTTKIGETYPMLLDREQIRRVFQNIILNAVQAMPEGGKLTIQTLNRGNSVEIVCKDTGVGIPEENLPKLFTPLFSTKAKGMGLGLAICKQIVKGHGGNLTAKSTVSRGSTFTVKLPIRVEEEVGEGLTITVGLPVERRVESE